MVSALGLGAAQIGDPRLDEGAVANILDAAIDAGMTLIDTARSYQLSEQRIGRYLGARRNDVVLSTKLGYGVDGVEDWTGPCIAGGIDLALRTLRTDRIDIVHLHSCPWQILERGEVVDALESAKRAGKVRAIAYSGENDDLAYAVASGRFDGLMASLNICDQRVIDVVLPKIANLGFIAKRPSANHPWRFDDRPVGDYCEEYWCRWRAMNVADKGHDWGELAIRFALSVPGVSSAIVGTGKLAHVTRNIQWAAAGPLDEGWFAEIRSAFKVHDQDWIGQI
jgi:aryl-alcohol dehydrogenase-like predicted oxidoreductase